MQNKLLVMDKVNLSLEIYANLLEGFDKSMPTLLSVTHVSDCDGVFSSIVVENHYKLNSKKLVDGQAIDIDYNVIVIPLANNGDDYLVKCIDVIKDSKVSISDIYVTDIGLKSKGHEAINKLDVDYKAYIDHHASANGVKHLFEHIYDMCYINEDYCATKNASDVLAFESSLMPYIEVTNDRDMWIRSMPVSDELTSLMKLLGFTRMYEMFMQGNRFLTYGDNMEIIIDSKYSLVLELAAEGIKRESKAFLSRLQTIDIGNDTDKPFKMGYTTYEGLNASDIAAATFEAREDIDIIAFVYNNAVSLRVRDTVDFDGKDVAVKRNGGGHPKACGYPLNLQGVIISNFINNFFDIYDEIELPVFTIA